MFLNLSMIIGVFFALAILVQFVINSASASIVKFTIPSNSKKCYSIEIPDKTLVTGHISSRTTTVNQNDGSRQAAIVSFIIDDRQGGKYYHNTNIKEEPSNFSFRTHGGAKEYQLCVATDHFTTLTNDIELEVNMNEDLFDATASHDSALLPEEAELIHMESVMKHIVDELDQMHFTERDLRDTNG
ncbi:hypothetical protein DI09_7p480 [Mitosporidium daphniae]|uniref:GOLD domain-containing protein n=1 Tax=Mitosporidium daphniae TaxID=1485682 RepID=A0A098VN96_9MICR|nr:uncharacterized protein DI09_7p480 [Mitosporidium daphniae]KGG50269.1 hypothetical protein DI09_7p480 [Mitosporidium daphniae]|eukprot:XP_013236696.1 uncharacterized protein DI09_7p480 [Mitosporidium daphniae]